MRLDSVRKGASGATTVAAGGSSFLVDLDVLEGLGLPASRLVPGAELDEEEAAGLALAAAAREAESRALSLLSRAEQSARMLRDKLSLRGFENAAIRIALERLEARGWLDDGRFARAYASSRLSRRGRKEGPATLVASLRNHGVDADVAAAAVAAVLGPEERRAALARAAVEALARCDGDRSRARSRLRALGYGGGEISECFSDIDESDSPGA